MLILPCLQPCDGIWIGLASSPAEFVPLPLALRSRVGKMQQTARLYVSSAIKYSSSSSVVGNNNIVDSL